MEPWGPRCLVCFLCLLFLLQAGDSSHFDSKRIRSIANLTKESCSLTRITSLECSGPLFTKKMFRDIRPYAYNLTQFVLNEVPNLGRISRDLFKNVSTTHLLFHGAFEYESAAFSQIAPGLNKLTMTGSSIIGMDFWSIFTNITSIKYLNVSNNELSVNVFDRHSRAYGQVHPHLEVLILDLNPLFFIDGSIFADLGQSELKTLSLSSCKLNHIHSDVFHCMPKLRRLVLTNNPQLFTMKNFNFFPTNLPPSLTYLSLASNEISMKIKATIINAFLSHLPNLETLNLNDNFLDPLSPDMFTQHETLRSICLANSKLTYINPGALSGLRNLDAVDLADNFFKSIPQPIKDSDLKILKIGRPGLAQHVEDFFIDPNITASQKLKELSLRHLHLKVSGQTDFGVASKALRVLKYENCVIRYERYKDDLEDRGHYFEHLFPNLRTLSFKDSSFIPKYVFKMSDVLAFQRLEELDLSGNALKPSPGIHLRQSLIRKLTLRGSLNHESFEKYNLRDFKHIEEIDLSDNEVDTCKNSSRFFDHAQNPKLRKLILRNNRIPFCFELSMMKLFCRLATLDMRQTLFKCSQNISYFYMMSLKCSVDIVGFKGGHGYDCQDESQVLPFIKYLSHHAGYDTFVPRHNDGSFQSKFIYLTGFAGLLLAVVLIFVLHKVRANWLFIRYALYYKCLFHSFSGRAKRRKNCARPAFDFDAFVSYDSQQEPWVQNYLLPNVEKEGQRRLCIHTRDFIPGKSIAENIAESLERSRVCIIVLSNSFLRSKWCFFEYHLALDLFQSHPEREVILIKKDPEKKLLSRLLSGDLQFYLQTHTYLEWSGDEQSEEKQRDFWKALLKTVKKRQ